MKKLNHVHQVQYKKSFVKLQQLFSSTIRPMTVEKGNVCDNRLWQYKENVNLIDLGLCT